MTVRQHRTEAPHQMVMSLARALHATFRSRTRAWPREVVSWRFQSDSEEGLKRSLGCPHQEGAKRQTGHNTPSSQDWKIPWIEEPGRLQSMGLLRVGHD